MTVNRFDILNRSLDIHKNYLVEASAGTGKTFSIENLIVRLLLESTCTIDQILVVTFTRAATRELKERIHANLTKSLGFFIQWLQDHETNTQAPDYLQAQIEQGKDNVLMAKRRLEQALFCFAEASVFTIHSFCQQMLSEYAFDLPCVSRNSSLLTSQQTLQVIRDFFRTGLRKEFYSKEQLHIALKRHQFDSTGLENAIVRILNKGGEIAPTPHFSTQFTLFKTTIQQLKQEQGLIGKNLLDDFLKQAPGYYGTCTRQKEVVPILREKIERFASLIDQETWIEADFDQLIADQLAIVDALDPAKLRPKAELQTESLNYPNLNPLLRATLLPLVQQAGSYSSILATMAYDCQHLLNKYLSVEDKFQHDDLLKTMLQSVRIPMIARKIRTCYQAAIIDEFQDTDAIQWEIFRTLFKHENCRLYLVGDPKQSIYGFRQADIYTYLEASRVLGHEARTSLDTNYRSQPSLVHALNTLFSKRSDGFIQLPKFGTCLDTPLMNPCDFISDKHFQDTRGSVHFCIAESKKGKSEIWPTHDMERTLFFPFIAHEILRLQDHVRFSQWAILVRDRFQADRLATYCKRKDIAVIVQRQAYLTDSTAYSALRELVYAIVHPYDTSALKQMLAGRIFGWTHEKILGLTQESILTKVYANVHSLNATLTEQGFARFFQELMHSCWDETGVSVIEHILSHQSGEEFYNDLMQLAEVLMEQQTQIGMSVEKLVTFLETLKHFELQQEERIKISQDLNQDSVKIMTLHSSKGLEFDFVFALGLVNRTLIKEEMIPIQIQDQGQWKASTVLDHASHQAYSLEIDAEKMRLLYVAMTRAKYRLYVPIAMPTDCSDDIPIGEASPMELFLGHHGGLHPFLDSIKVDKTISYSAIPDEYSTDYKEESSLPKPTKPAVHLTEPQVVIVPNKPHFVHSFTSLTRVLDTEPRLMVPSTPPQDLHNPLKTIHTLPAGSEIGKLLHLMLEKIPFSVLRGMHGHDELLPMVMSYLQDHSFDGWEQVICKIIFNTLTTVLIPSEEPFSISEISQDKSYQEMEFLYPCHGHETLQEKSFNGADGLSIAGNFLKGVIDFVFEHKGKYYLIDWKSNWLGPSLDSYSPVHLRQAMHEHEYHLQATIYIEAFKRYLKLVDRRPFEECFGGCFYLFLRGIHPTLPHSGVYKCGQSTHE